MEFLEKDLETIIWESSNDELLARGLNFSGKRFRQLKIGNYGIADLVTMERSYDYDNLESEYSTRKKSIIITVYELKKDKIGISAFLQAVGYVKGIKNYIENRCLFEEYRVEYKIRLIGRSVDDSGSFIYLPDFIFNDVENITDYYFISRPLSLEYFTYDYKIDGILFNEVSGYSLVNEGF